MVTATEGVDIITHSTRSKYKIVAYDKYTISKQGTKIRLFNNKKNYGNQKRNISDLKFTYTKKMSDGLAVCQNEIIKI